MYSYTYIYSHIYHQVVSGISTASHIHMHASHIQIHIYHQVVSGISTALSRSDEGCVLDSACSMSTMRTLIAFTTVSSEKLHKVRHSFIIHEVPFYLLLHVNHAHPDSLHHKSHLKISKKSAIMTLHMEYFLVWGSMSSMRTLIAFTTGTSEISQKSVLMSLNS